MVVIIFFLLALSGFLVGGLACYVSLKEFYDIYR